MSKTEIPEIINYVESLTKESEFDLREVQVKLQALANNRLNLLRLVEKLKEDLKQPIDSEEEV